MTEFKISDDWKLLYAGAYVGLLSLRNAHNDLTNPELRSEKEKLAERLREKYGHLTRDELRSLPEVRPYVSHYKRYRKTYHLLLQLESIVFKGKSIPRVSGLVDVMFMAELENHLLTAGHDCDTISPPLGIYTGDDAVSYVGFNEQIITPKEGDPYIADTKGILSNVIYGPARRGSIQHQTSHVLYTVYTFPGNNKEQLHSHLETIHRYATLFAPDAEVDFLLILGDEA